VANGIFGETILTVEPKQPTNFPLKMVGAERFELSTKNQQITENKEKSIESMVLEVLCSFR
jgi:hypothetical protein